MNPEPYYRSYRLGAAIFLIWLFHISGLLGILLGYEQWFIPKTPLNLLLSGLLFVWAFPVRRTPALGLFFVFGLTGMVVEWIGVHSGWLFGAYAYGENLGVKWYGVPLLIGLNWALLGMASGAVATRWVRGAPWRVLLGASLMTLLDLVIEPVAPIFDFWEFEEGHAPWTNYLSWFAVALMLQAVYQYYRPEKGYLISLNLLAAQFAFFLPLAVLESL